MCGDMVMQILDNKNTYNEIYKGIIRKTYECSVLNGMKFNIDKETFINICLSDIKNYCTLSEITTYLMFGKEKDLNVDVSDIFYSELRMDSKRTYTKVNEYLKNKFTIDGKLKEEMLIANILYIIENNDDYKNTLLWFFEGLEILDKYKFFFYIFSLIQTTESILYLPMKVYVRNMFFYKFKDFFEEVKNIKEIIEIIGENAFKRMFIQTFDEYLRKSNNPYSLYELQNNLYLFIKHFDTYKWLDSKRKKRLSRLAKKNIYYAEHAKYLESIGKNEYLSEMTYKLMNDECVVV